ncbi:MAG TPA: phosphoribosylglycinamide formyltransferase [Cyclobacteriaceae bacterium]|nr:phosphoribosylglycinamide formyltransferase [Cyclobacteriaceae bacterium]
MESKNINLAIFASGNGTNAGVIMEHFKNGSPIRVALVLSNNPSAGVLARAARFGVPTKVFDKKQFRDSDDVVRWLREYHITHIVLAGFLWLVPENILRAYAPHIVNIHPALLPKFGGKGMYGDHVHHAVLSSNEKETGITIHEVNDKFDEGKILFQASCSIEPGDTAAAIANKVHALEHAHFPRVIRQWVMGEKVTGDTSLNSKL